MPRSNLLRVDSQRTFPLELAASISMMAGVNIKGLTNFLELQSSRIDANRNSVVALLSICAIILTVLLDGGK